MNASHAESEASAAPVLLRGTRNGLEVFIDAGVSLDEIAASLEGKLGESPSFFEGGAMIARFDGDPPSGALACLEQTAGKFGLRVIEVRSNRQEKDRARRAALAAVVSLEQDEHEHEHATPTPLPAPAPAPTPTPTGPKLVTGPIRSGVRLKAPVDLVVFGDVNPGAEIEAGRNIIVLGVLRGVAHASAHGGEDGFVLALRLQPQQVRIGGLVARAGDSEAAPEGAEIAYAAEGGIVVEQYAGKLPGGVAPRRR